MGQNLLNFLVHLPFICYNSDISCPILMKLHIRVQETTRNLGFGHVEVIWHNWAKKGPNMGVAVPRAAVGGWSPGPPQKFGHRS